jgi:hypothetical protein
MKAKLLITLLVIFGIALVDSFEANAQSLPGYWSDLKPGKYAVGFKSICVFDSTRQYDLSLGDSTSSLRNKKSGRPVLLNIFYPAANNSGVIMHLKDYFQFPENEDTHLFFEALQKYQYKYSRLYAVEFNTGKKSFAGDSAMIEKTRDEIFEKYISSNTIAHKNAVALNGEFPIVIYHEGLGGTVDENFLLHEYLASNGYIVIVSAFQVNDGSNYIDQLGNKLDWQVSTGENNVTFEDFTFLINYTKINHLTASKKVFLMGHSYGANSSIVYIGQGHKNVTGIIPLDSDFGYSTDFKLLERVYKEKYYPFYSQRLGFYNNLPAFCVGRKEALFGIMDSLSLSRRHYLNIADMKHNDFTAQGGIGRFFCLPYVKEKEKYTAVHDNYLHLCGAILQFLDACSKGEKGLAENAINIRTGWKFKVYEPGQQNPFNVQTGYYQKTNQWKEYAKLIQQYINENGASADWLNGIVWDLYENADDNLVMKQAASWLTPYMNDNTSYAIMDTYAAALYKAKDYALSKTWAEKAITKGKTENEDTKETEKLLQSVKEALQEK